VRSSIAPLPVVVVKMVVHVVPSVDTWIVYALAYAASQVSFTWLTLAVVPRSTCNHCGSTPSLLAQRVPVRLPSNAAPAGNDDDSSEEAVAGLPWDSRTGPPPTPVTVRLYAAEWAAEAPVPVTVMVNEPVAADAV